MQSALIVEVRIIPYWPSSLFSYDPNVSTYCKHPLHLSQVVYHPTLHYRLFLTLEKRTGYFGRRNVLQGKVHHKCTQLSTNQQQLVNTLVSKTCIQCHIKMCQWENSLRGFTNHFWASCLMPDWSAPSINTNKSYTRAAKPKGVVYCSLRSPQSNARKRVPYSPLVKWSVVSRI